jgi:hypothetical protein
MRKIKSPIRVIFGFLYRGIVGLIEGGLENYYPIANFRSSFRPLMSNFS